MKDRWEHGGDDYTVRLLSFLQWKLGEVGASIETLKDGKWVLRSGGRKWFVKRYSSEKRFIIQEMLIKELLQGGFDHVIPMHPLHQTGVISFEGSVIGISYWLETASAIDYADASDRQEAWRVLKGFHRASRRIQSPWVEEVPEFRWIDKWKKRMTLFDYHLPYLQHFIAPYYLSTYHEWGRWALEELDALGPYKGKRSMVHGDVAHHNFLRGTDGRVYLIDFDLLSRSPAITDDIQMANRVLPYLDWSLADVMAIPSIRKYRHDAAFFLGLMYPSDIFREWNRFIREGQSYREHVWPYLVQITLGQFHQRMRFVQELHSELRRIITHL
ncbi:hypothetical protein ANABIO32_07290 [Rossellomorea marisflavi]|nr:hypothetical protein ANABIO32_07290 [Rossellomorea marisflavi]